MITKNDIISSLEKCKNVKSLFVKDFNSIRKTETLLKFGIYYINNIKYEITQINHRLKIVIFETFESDKSNNKIIKYDINSNKEIKGSFKLTFTEKIKYSLIKFIHLILKKLEQ